VLAAANPDDLAELHSTTRAPPFAALANANANVVAPWALAHRTTGSTCSSLLGVHDGAIRAR
jgi:hypothetical protein